MMELTIHATSRTVTCASDLWRNTSMECSEITCASHVLIHRTIPHEAN